MRTKRSNQIKLCNGFFSFIMVGVIALISSFLVRRTSQRALFATGNSGYCSLTPDNDNFLDSWHISKIQAEEAWEITTGTNSVSVGVIDSGISAACSDLSCNIDTILSKDCYSSLRGAPLQDTNGHGTKVASLIGSKETSSSGVVGLCWSINLVSLRNDDSISNNTDGNAASQAILYASQEEIPILNLSSIFTDVFEESGPSLPYITSGIRDEMDYHIQQYEGLFVVCAGNKNSLMTTYDTFYPQTFNYDNVIVVGSSDENDEKCSGSNYGSGVVDLFAPGYSVPALAFDSYNNQTVIDYSFGGTSAAAPLVAGTAALMLSVNPNLTTSELKSLIMNNVDQISSLSDKCVSGGRLNTYKAVKAAIPGITTFGTFVNGIQSLPSNKHQFYKISLTPGLYHFESSSNLDMSGYLYSDIQNSPIAQSDNTSGDFSFDYFTNINKTVYLKIRNDSLIDGNYSYKVTKTSNHYHSYDNEYVWFNNTKHRAMCSCGMSSLQGHVVSSNNTHLCLLCNGYALMGFIIQSTNPYIEVGNDSRLLNNGMIILGDIDYNLFTNNELDINSLYLGESI